jgi:hypothetical protein
LDNQEQDIPNRRPPHYWCIKKADFWIFPKISFFVLWTLLIILW